MLKQLEKYIQENRLCSTDDRLLAAVSGGADSVVLLHLLVKAGYLVALAHCNFNLRERESDQDEQFVKALAEKYQVEGHFVSFQTGEYAANHKISIEMAARELRYQWFEQLCSEKGYSKIATGHHLNDSIETLLLNLTRGTGINGLTGISSVNGRIIRPLLFATRNEIEEYARSEKLEYRHDSSNDSTEYMRNIIRLQVIPALKSINPAFEQVMKRNISNFTNAAQIYNQSVQKTLMDLVVTKNDLQTIDIKKLQNTFNYETVLFELISPLGFSNDNVTKLAQCLGKESGRMFFSESHQLLLDRDCLFIEPINKNTDAFVINNIDDFRKLPFQINTQVFGTEGYLMDKSIKTANLDAQKTLFPLTVRHWNRRLVLPAWNEAGKKIKRFFYRFEN
jgi:tRNA(Ile)-lysidine synthase